MKLDGAGPAAGALDGKSRPTADMRQVLNGVLWIPGPGAADHGAGDDRRTIGKGELEDPESQKGHADAFIRGRRILQGNPRDTR